MADDIIRSEAKYQQLAARLAADIETGVYPPGSLLPSETQLMERYGVSRPTVRAAVAELRAMALVDSQHGKGSFVRTTTGPTAAIATAITRSGKKFTAYDGQFTEAEDPSVSRTHLSGTEAQLLQRDDETAAFTVDRLLIDSGKGLRALHRTLLPFDVAEDIPELAEHPDTQPDAIYALLTAAGRSLRWTDDVRARLARPDERTTLRASQAACLLVMHRITSDSDGRPFLLETLTADAEQARLIYPISASRATPRKP